MESFTAAQNVLSDVMLVISEPQALEEVVVTHEGPDQGGDTLYWLQNLTDMPVEFWTRGPGQSHRALPIAFKPSELGLLQFSLDCTTSCFKDAQRNSIVVCPSNTPKHTLGVSCTQLHCCMMHVH